MIYKFEKTQTRSDHEMSDDMEENFLISPYGYDGPCICMRKKRKFITIAFSLTKVWDLDLITLFVMAIILLKSSCNTATILLLELPIFAILTSVVDLVQVYNMRHNKP